MNLRQIRRALNRSLEQRGVWKTVVFGSKRALGMPNRPPVRMIRHPFDVEHGVQTSGVIFRKERDGRYTYHGVAPSLFRQALQKWQSLIPSHAKGIEEYAFIDLGCGMGRAVLLASELPFHQVEGVEFDLALVDTARSNVAKWVVHGRARCPIAIHHVDALEYSFPRHPSLIFLYNPFGERILKPILSRLQQLQREIPAPIDVLYVHPKCGYLFEDPSRFQLLWTARVEYDQIDKDANEFGGRGERCSLYRFRQSQSVCARF